MSDAVIVIKSTEDWNKALADAGDKAVVVDFFADWCGPCKMIAPKFVDLANSHQGKVVFLKVNVDECEEVAKICNITAMPTFQVWKNKACVDTLVGANLDKLVGLVGKHAA
mmetsp:Transcript_13959/g.37717  ORF Transcript_13959/g.37717 Transcript_13959/m.37717 type:complete len:111 (+) Transcript_13959:159-491(+)